MTSKTRYLNIDDVRRITGRHRRTLYRWIAGGVLPEPTRIYGRLYWREQELYEALGLTPEDGERQALTPSGTAAGAGA